MVIDDKDMLDVLKSIERRARSKQIEFDYDQLNIGGHIEPEVLDAEGNLDVDKSKALLKQRFTNRHFDIVVCDYDLSVQNIDGVELLRKIGHECFYNGVRYIIYSSLLDTILQEKIEKGCYIDPSNSKVKPKDSLIKEIRQLVNSNYLAFVSRDNLEKTIVDFLKNDLTIEDVMDELASTYPDRKFAYDFINGIKGKTLQEMKCIILNNDNLRSEVMKGLFEQSILYLTEKMTTR